MSSLVSATGLESVLNRLNGLQARPSTPGKAGHVILAQLDRFSLRAHDVRRPVPEDALRSVGEDQPLYAKSDGGPITILKESPRHSDEDWEASFLLRKSGRVWKTRGRLDDEWGFSCDMQGMMKMKQVKVMGIDSSGCVKKCQLQYATEVPKALGTSAGGTRF